MFLQVLFQSYRYLGDHWKWVIDNPPPPPTFYALVCDTFLYTYMWPIAKLTIPYTHAISGFGPLFCIFSDVEVQFYSILLQRWWAKVDTVSHSHTLTRGEFEHRKVKTQLIITDKTIILK